MNGKLREELIPQFFNFIASFHHLLIDFTVLFVFRLLDELPCLLLSLKSSLLPCLCHHSLIFGHGPFVQES